MGQYYLTGNVANLISLSPLPNSDSQTQSPRGKSVRDEGAKERVHGDYDGIYGSGQFLLQNFELYRHPIDNILSK